MATSEYVHLSVLFHLVPLNAAAAAVVADPRNLPFVSSVDGGPDGLDIGLLPSAVRNGRTLATLGRASDIRLRHEQASRLQCAFVVGPDAQAILLHDTSSSQSTQVYADPDLAPRSISTSTTSTSTVVVPLKRDLLPRRVCVGAGLNPVLGIGSAGGDALLFRFL